MLLSYPSYYEKFRCIAAACPDSCCKEWDVLVDDRSAEAYLAMEGRLGEAIREKLLQDEDGIWYFAITDGRCPMWRDDGLCRIQAALDHDALCQTCRDFPRLTHDYGAFMERGLALSCPEAAKIILSAPHSWCSCEISGGEEPEYTQEDMDILLHTRKVMLTILSGPTRSVREALLLALLYGYRAQDLLDGGEEEAFDAEAELEFARQFGKTAPLSELVAFYQGLEILTPAWETLLSAPGAAGEWCEELRQLAIYGVERYWLQAISDFDLVGRVKMILAGCILVRHLGGNVVETAQKYAKEIENSAENVESILDGAYSSPALTDEKLLGWLL